MVFIKMYQFFTVIFSYKFTYDTFRKKTIIYIAPIIPCIPAKLCKQPCICNCKRDICKACFLFGFCSNCKYQQCIWRDMEVITAFSLKCVIKRFKKTMVFHGKHDWTSKSRQCQPCSVYCIWIYCFKDFFLICIIMLFPAFILE